MEKMKQNVRYHPLATTAAGGPITLMGYSQYKPESLACFTADGGDHFTKFGITEGSMLLVSMGAAPEAGDLVVTGTPQISSVRLYIPESSDAGAAEECPTVSEESQIIAVILGAFNFYR